MASAWSFLSPSSSWLGHTPFASTLCLRIAMLSMPLARLRLAPRAIRMMRRLQRRLITRSLWSPTFSRGMLGMDWCECFCHFLSFSNWVGGFHWIPALLHVSLHIMHIMILWQIYNTEYSFDYVRITLCPPYFPSSFIYSRL